jgi:ABC-2 type transport system ATP-binding protein
MTAITVQDLHKSYGKNEVLKGISFTVKTGEIFAVLGVNGAGKTTLLEIIEGLRAKDGGEILIRDTPHAGGLSLLGVQLQSSTLPAQIKVREALKLYALWNQRGAKPSPLYRFGLESVKNKYYKDLSTGWKRRLHLALAIQSDPDIVILDEPTAGLDVEARAALHTEIRALKAAGKTIILASHDMAEVEALCDRLVMLRGGQIAFGGTVNEFTAVNKGKFKVHIKLAGGGYTVYEIGNLNAELSALLERTRAGGGQIADLKIERPTLEDSFLSIAATDGKEVVKP